MTPFYEDPTSFPYIERAVLMEDIKLPIYNEKKKLKRNYFYDIFRLISDFPYIYRDEYHEQYKDKEYKLAYNELKNIDAKFYIPVLMTNVSNKGSEVKTANRAPKTTGFKGNIKSLPYDSSNCTVLTIPKYILIQFLDQKNEIIGSKDPIVPKGTEFLVTCVGGNMDLDHMRIIGLYTLTYKRKDFPNLKDDYYGGNNVK